MKIGPYGDNAMAKTRQRPPGAELGSGAPPQAGGNAEEGGSSGAPRSISGRGRGGRFGIGFGRRRRSGRGLGQKASDVARNFWVDNPRSAPQPPPTYWMTPPAAPPPAPPPPDPTPAAAPPPPPATPLHAPQPKPPTSELKATGEPIPAGNPDGTVAVTPIPPTVVGEAVPEGNPDGTVPVTVIPPVTDPYTSNLPPGAVPVPPSPPPPPIVIPGGIEKGGDGALKPTLTGQPAEPSRSWDTPDGSPTAAPAPAASMATAPSQPIKKPEQPTRVFSDERVKTDVRPVSAASIDGFLRAVKLKA